MFSSRTPADLTPNRLARRLDALRRAGRPLIDLTESNPTRAGFVYPDDLLSALSAPPALTYTPSPFGLEEAREAIAGDYSRRGVAVSRDRIVLASSTSDAYGLLFKLLADAGDEVLTPRPSYPLFDHLTRLELAAPVPYDLEYHGTWSLDFASIERALTPRTRAVLLVSPNNPTGSFVKAAELDRLAGLCRSHGLALVGDEVFADYELQPGAAARGGSTAGRTDVLTFSLGGLSKSVGLPQMKLAWIAVGGPDGLVSRALERLEMICDTYLSVSTPVQVAAAALLERGALVRDQIRRRIVANDRSLRARVGARSGCRVLAGEGGWSAVVQVPSLRSEEELVLDLLDADGVVVHPGYFFDFPRESYLVVSLLPAEDRFSQGVERIARRFEATSEAGS